MNNLLNNYHLISWGAFVPNASTICKDKQSHKKANLFNDYICLDTETSHNHNEDNPICWVYQWCFSYQNTLVYGRTPSQLMQALKKICDINMCDDKNKIVVYVHNLPYDFSYLSQYIQDTFGEHINLLAIANHKVFYIEYEQIIFKCSYKLCNKSLKQWAIDLNAKHKKLVGAVDYDVIRYQDSKLVRNDWRYMFYDVVTMRECLEIQMQQYNDNIVTIPMTSTGYVRREIRKAYRQNQKNFRNFTTKQIDKEIYTMLCDEFSGGITHGNRFYKGKTIKGTIKHRDFVSHYPSQQRTQLFPMGRMYCLYDDSCNDDFTLEDVFNWSKEYFCIVHMAIKNLRLKTPAITMPYAQASHFKREYSKGTHFIEDNGRILAMQGESIVTLSDSDLKWIDKQYNYDYCILSVYVSKLGKLPDYLIDTIDTHFKGKSDYKDKEKALIKANAPDIDIFGAHMELLRSKGIINGIYGCSASHIVHDNFKFNGTVWENAPITEEDIENTLYKYFRSRNNFMRYEWGCATTCHARNELMEFIELIGYENYLYCDTDSIFYISTPEIEKRIEERNKALYNDSISKGAYITTEKGKKIVYNQFDDEEEEITQFRFLHAKCYAYVELKEGKDKLHCTVAGVSAFGKNKKSREHELGKIDKLEDKFVFKQCGGTTISYIDDMPKCQMIIDGHTLDVGAGAIIRNVNKTLNDSIDNDELLLDIDY